MTPAAREILGLPSPDDWALLTEQTLREAEQARSDFAAFFDFVMRDPERPKQPMRLVAHQRAGVEFILHHPKCVIRWPLDTGKSSIVRAFILWLLGRDPTARGLVIGNTQAIARKNFAPVRDYITDPKLGPWVRTVFKRLERGKRPGDKWSETELTIDRPAGYADPSLRAVGLDTEIQGSKLTFAVCDDLLSEDNTSTIDQRTKLKETFHKEILGRLVPLPHVRCLVVNVPWDRDDLTYHLEREMGWPTLTMDLEGGVEIQNAAEDFDTDLLRPSRRGGGWHWLTDFDPDPLEQKPLYPARYPIAQIEKLRTDNLPHVYATQRRCNPRQRTDARCQEEWIVACKQSGAGLRIQRGVEELTEELGYRPPTFTGVDIGISENEANDRNAIFTWALLRDERRRIVSADGGFWDAPTLLDRVIDEVERWGSVAGVESNAGQVWLVQFARRLKRAIRVTALYTGKANKHDKQFGVEGVFLELKQGQWVIPCSSRLIAPRGIHDACEACLDYRPPPAHTPDELMAWWLSLEMARKMGFGTGAAGGRLGKPRGLTVGGTF